MLELLASLVLELEARVSCAQSPSQPASALRAEEDGFRAAIAARDHAALRRWIDANPRLAFHRAKALALAYLADALEPREEEALRLREDMRFLTDALGDRDTAQLARAVLAWGPPELQRYRVLSDGFARLLDSSDARAPSSEELAALRAELDSLGVATLFFQPLAALARKLHDAARAGEAVDFAAWIARKGAACGDPWSVCWAEEWLGLIAWKSGDLRGAADRYSRACELESILGDPAYHANLLSDLASILMGLGELDRGLQRAVEAVEIAEPLSDALPVRRAREMQASILAELGELERALEICFACSAADRGEPPRNGVQARIDLLASNILADVGRLESALTYGLRALETARLPEVQEEAPGLSAEIELALGLLLGDLGRSREGLEHLEHALHALQQAGDPRGVAWAHKNRGWVLLKERRFEEAAKAFEQGLVEGRELHLPFLEGWCALGIAESLTFRAHSDDELDSTRIERALLDAERGADDLQDLHLYWRIAAARGRCHALEGRLEPALNCFADAVRLIERWRARLAAPGLLTHFLRDKSDPYRDAAVIAAQLGRVEEALSFSELLRARVLFEMRSTRTGALDQGDNEALRPMRRRIAEIEARLQAQAQEAGSADRPRLREELRAAEADLDAALLDAEITGPRRFHLTGQRRRPATVRDLQDRMAASDLDTVLSYLAGPDATLAFALSADGLRLEILPVGEAQLARWIERLRAPIGELQAGTLDLANLDFDVETARALHAALVEPLAPHLGECIAIVAGGPLASLPFGLLVNGGESLAVDTALPFAHLRGLRFLIEDHSLAYLPSLSLLGEAPPPSTRPQDMTVFAASRGGLIALADQELAAIRRCFAGDSLRVVERARPSDVIALAPRAHALHFAAHGLLDPDYPSHGHLLLEGERGPERLEAWQIERLPLSAEVAVLSACHTAEGVWYSGEGLIGLTRSFLAAGCKEVVASQWAVEDRATAQLMELFYAGVADGLGSIEAMRRAQLELLRSNDPRGFARAHPYFWAGWVVQR